MLPSRLILELTARCNFNCPFCYCVWHEFPELAGEGDLPTSKWREIIAYAVKNGAKDLLFSGGEVLLRDDLPELLNFACELLPGGVGIFTNLRLMTEDFLQFCKAREISISTSLPGLLTYPEMTGSDADCYGALSWIARAAEVKHPMSVSVTMTSRNRGEAVNIYRACALLGAGQIQFGAMMAEGRGKRHLDLMLSHDEWEQVKQTISRKCRGVPYAFCDEYICHCRWQPGELLRKYAPPNPSPCPAGKDFGVISPNGKYRKCLHTIETTELQLV